MTPGKSSSGPVVAGAILSALMLPLWIVQLSLLSDLTGSDAAGNGLAQAFAAGAIILLWALLAVLASVAYLNGDMPAWAGVATAILIPASGFAAMAALELLTHPGEPPFRWPLVIPALVPPLVVIFCFWALVPLLRAAIPASLAAGFAWGVVLGLSAAILPMQAIRHAAIEQEDALREKQRADFARLPADAPLWEWTPFLAAPDRTMADAAVARMRALERRQGDAETMLERGDFPLAYLGSFDLDPTPALCEKARGLLRRRADALVPKTADAQPYTVVDSDVAGALSAMKWLVGYGCSCDEESRAWEAMANAYRGTNFDVVELKELRDPKALGRTLREYPDRFSMLTPRAHLKGWLKFTDDKDLRERTLAGARALPNRTADAVEILNDKYDDGARWKLLHYLPLLDLEATAPLCAAAAKVIFAEFAPIYRPRGDDPRPYSELLERLGGSEPLPALIWLAQHGCDVDVELKEADALVRTYQDSPARAAMLATLNGLRKR